ncbi:hypothetical protein RJD40_18870 [Vibrio scophthalmi]|uniref:hypothetical protein n=1 Tax=Vibrio scophthalmi TaxID=45658 RepID=UPI003AAB4930
MSALQAIPTPHGIDILNSELKSTVTQYQLVGALTHDAASDTLYDFHTATIETSYYDEYGVLTFILNLPIETHFNEYLHRIDVLDSNNQAVILCETPKIALAKGIGGMVTLKAPISGQAGDVVFKHGEYVTEAELKEIYLPPIQFQPWDAKRTYQTGEICTRIIDGEFRVMQMYAGPNMECSGKDPADPKNRHLEWQSTDAPFWWIDYKADITGMSFPWLSVTAPEWAVPEINLDLETAVYWRLKRLYPLLVFVRDGVEYINTGEIRGEFFRVLDQGRGLDIGRTIGSHQDDDFEAHFHFQKAVYGGGSINEPSFSSAFASTYYSGNEAKSNNGNFPHAGTDSWGASKHGNYKDASQQKIEGKGIETRPANIARPWMIAI